MRRTAVGGRGTLGTCDDVRTMVTTPTAGQLRTLAACEALLDAPEFQTGRWQGGTPGADGVIQMPWFEHSRDLLAFHRAVGGAGIELDQRWMDWAGTPHGQRLLQDPGQVADASPDDLVSLLTACIRGDRFSEGTLAHAVDSGLFRAILRRAAVLAEGATNT
jgi:hypothetical protein